MWHTVLLCFSLLFVGCSDDDISVDLGGPLTFTGTACGSSVSYSGVPDARIDVIEARNGEIDTIVVADGPLIDTEDASELEAYFADHDLIFGFGFSDPEPFEPHVTGRIFDSVIFASGFGVAGLTEDLAEQRVEILAIDVDAKTIDIQLDLAIFAFTEDVPPNGPPEACGDPGRLSGRITGTFATIENPG